MPSGAAGLTSRKPREVSGPLFSASATHAACLFGEAKGNRLVTSHSTIGLSLPAIQFDQES